MITRLVLALWLIGGDASAACRQALVVGLDISGSVDPSEYRQQVDGLAGALGAAAVRAALLAMPEASVDLAVFEWSGPGDQRVLVPWVTLNNDAAIDTAVARLLQSRRGSGDPATGLGQAVLFGGALLTQRPGCWRHVLDLSGDGKSNSGPRPQDIRDAAPPADMVINALVIGSVDAAIGDRRQVDVKELSGYFTANVIRGPDAFVEVAVGFENFRDAMERKLLRELQVIVLGRAAEPYGSPRPPGTPDRK